MLKQFENLSSWREDNITVEPHETYRHYFSDTLPNMMVVVNPNEAVIKIGIATTPTEERYEFKVEYNTTEVVGRPTGTKYLYLYNDSSIKANLKLFSVNKEFDISALKNMNVSLEGYTLEANSEISGFKNGVSLPSGNNTIGRVLLDNTESQKLTSIETLLNNLTTANVVPNTYINLFKIATIITKLQEEVINAINNKIVEVGDVNVNLSPIQTQLDNILLNSNNIGIINGNLTENVLPVLQNTYNYLAELKVVRKEFHEYAQENFTGSTAIDFNSEADFSELPNCIENFVNDGQTDIILTLSKDGTERKTITVKSGENIGDFRYTCNSILVDPKTSGEKISWRLLISRL